MDERIPPGGIQSSTKALPSRSRDGRAFDEGGRFEIHARLIRHEDNGRCAGETRSSTARADASRSGADWDGPAQVPVDSQAYFIDG